jgi:nucleoid-associated protein YgaU
MRTPYLSTDRYSLDASGQTASRTRFSSSPYVTYTSQYGDTFMSLSIKFLNEQSRYWEIADINPHVQWPDRIPVGTAIRIPT